MRTLDQRLQAQQKSHDAAFRSLKAERDKYKAQRDALLKELARVVQLFGADEEKGLLPAGFATFNGARAAIAKCVEDK